MALHFPATAKDMGFLVRKNGPFACNHILNVVRHAFRTKPPELLRPACEEYESTAVVAAARGADAVIVFLGTGGESPLFK